MESRVVWKDGMAFDAHLDGFTITIDADAKFGGRGLGPKPKGLTLASLAGCTAMDVIAILTKMRIAPRGFDVTADGELADDHPRRFTHITITYRFEGDELPVNKLLRAVKLSEERYCGISATLRPAVDMDNVVYLNGKRIAE